MKVIKRICLITVLLAAGFAAGFAIGKSSGFSAGSEWALVQAELLAMEAGLEMPVYLADGQFRVVIKQPRQLYRRAWQRADHHEERLAYVTGGKNMSDTILLARSSFPAGRK